MGDNHALNNHALNIASIIGDAEAMSALLKAGANPNLVNRMGDTLIWRASLFGQHEVVRVLLDAGADPNSSINKQSALHIAASSNRKECVKLLLNAGADPNAQDNSGTTATDITIRHRRTEIRDLLISAGGDAFPVYFQRGIPGAFFDAVGPSRVHPLVVLCLRVIKCKSNGVVVPRWVPPALCAFSWDIDACLAAAKEFGVRPPSPPPVQVRQKRTRDEKENVCDVVEGVNRLVLRDKRQK